LRIIKNVLDILLIKMIIVIILSTTQIIYSDPNKSFIQSNNINIPIKIDKYNTEISPNPVVIGESCNLRINIDNEETIDIQCSILVSATNVEVVPNEIQNITAKRGTRVFLTGVAEGNTIVTYHIMPIQIGTLPIKIDLLYDGKQVDFFTIELNVVTQIPEQNQSKQSQNVLWHIDYLKLLSSALISLVFWVFIDSQKIFGESIVYLMIIIICILFGIFFLQILGNIVFLYVLDICLGIGAGTLLSPIPILIIRRKIVDATSKIKKMKDIDKKILELAVQYGGIITPIILVFKGITDLENAQKVLNRYVKTNQAIKRKSNEIVFYDFPSARTHLSNLDQKIIDIFLKFQPSLSRVEIISRTGLSIEAIEKAMNRLETNGIVIYDNINDIYRLRGLEIK